MNSMMGFLEAYWPVIEDAAGIMILAALAFITYWFKSHIGKSNGEGTLNAQTTAISKKVDDLSNQVKSNKVLINTKSCSCENCPSNQKND